MTDKDEGALALNVEARERLKQFHDDGLVWLVNTAILHPRGYALAIHYDDLDDKENSLPRGLSIVGDGSEPWVFGVGGQEETLDSYEKAEAAREALWTPKLKDKISRDH